MGRRSRTARLTVWMNGEEVGGWRVDSRGEHELSYADSWLSHPDRRPLSLSMPLRPEPYRGPLVHDYFDNLLPDSDAIRRRLQARFGTRSSGAFDLLAEVGRDCVGAVQLVAGDHLAPDPRSIQGQPLTDEEVAGILAGVQAPPLGQRTGEEFRISLAGAREKTALLRHSDTWMRPLGPTPTTHILKLPIGQAAQGIDLSTSVENEWLCHRILNEFEVPVAACAMATFGDQKTLIVERFDRRPSRGGCWIVRLPLEDLCQATGTPGARKYENEGGPGIRTVMDVLLGSHQAREDRLDFFRTQVLFWLLCAIDGHAKNFSLFLEPQGRFRLTPRYDVLSAYPVIGPGMLHAREVTMAMAVWAKNRHYRWHDIGRRHWVETARACSLSGADACLDDLAARVPSVVEAVAAALPAGFPDRVAGPILDGLRRCGSRLG
ncbi:MAG: type II toxin-antitoxin system HipA family toxin [Candidatus Eremiobacterota bacterium]